jgi:hypothetical protein
VIGRLKALIALLPAALGANGGLKVEGVAGGVAQPVSGTVTANAGTGPFPVSDNAGSLTVDAPVATPVAARLSDGAAFYDAAKTGQLPAALGAGGGLKVDGSGTALPVSGTVTANAGTGPFPVSDNAGSLTVDAPVGTPLWVRLSDGAAAFVGQKAMASSIPVVIASDQSAVPGSNAVGSQVDGHSAAIGATTDLAAASTLIGRVFALKNVQKAGGAAAINTASMNVSGGTDETSAQILRLNAKGTQGAFGLATQDLKDAGRVNIALTAEFAHAQTAETLLTMTESRDGAATATFTSKTITSGKRLRVTSIFLHTELLGTGTTPIRSYLRLRINTAGATTAGSPVQLVVSVGVETAILKSSKGVMFDLPDGFEILGDGTKTYGFTLETPDWVITTATGRSKITVFGFEY